MGYRHDQVYGGGLRGGLFDCSTGLVHQKDCGLSSGDQKQKLRLAFGRLRAGCGLSCPEGGRNYSLHLTSDNGSQPTSASFMRACSVLGIKQAFTAYNNPNGNANTERLIRTIKEELVWVNEFTSLEEVEIKL